MKSIDLSKSKFGDRFLGANGNEYVYIGKQFLEGTIGHMLVSYYNKEDLLLTPDNTYLQCTYEYFNDGTPRFASYQRLVKKL